MSFLEYTVGRLREGESPTAFEEAAVRWFSHLEKHKRALFPEWMSTRCFWQCNEEGNPSGKYVLVTESKSLEGLQTHRADPIERSKGIGGSEASCRTRGLHGPHDPARLFAPDSVTVEYLQSLHEHMWFDYSAEKSSEEQEMGAPKVRYLEYESWELAEGTDAKAYEEAIDTWFQYVVLHKKRLFDEWVSARYYGKVDADGNPTGGYAMVFEYADHAAFRAYKRRRRHSYDTNTGDYLIYRDNDPYRFFNVDTVVTDGLWPLEAGGRRNA